MIQSKTDVMVFSKGMEPKSFIVNNKNIIDSNEAED